MRITTSREEGSALLRLEGRIDREWAGHLSGALERLLQEGVRSLWIDLSHVSYISSAATEVLARRQAELAMLRGEMQLIAVPAVVQETFAVVGWDAASGTAAGGESDLRRSSWHARADMEACGTYELATIDAGAQLECRLIGDPGRLATAPYAPDDCEAVAVPRAGFGLGIGAIGGGYAECAERLGELVAAAGCVAYFPSGGARVPDYIVAGGEARIPPRAVLASGLMCEGAFSHLIRFSPRPESRAVPLSELAAIGLDAAGGGTAGMVIAAEAAGLCGVRLRRSPADAASPLRFELPALREWLLYPTEPTHGMTTALIVGVVARRPEGRLADHLRPLGGSRRLQGHFHAAVLSYLPLPQRTVELALFLRELFAQQPLRDVLHLIRDSREGVGVPESQLIRGVAWAGAISQID